MQWGCLQISPKEIMYEDIDFEGDHFCMPHTIDTIADKLLLDVHSVFEDIGIAIFVETEEKITAAEQHASSVMATITRNPQTIIDSLHDHVDLYTAQKANENNGDPSVSTDLINLEKTTVLRSATSALHAQHYSESESQQKAKDIMSENMFSIRDAMIGTMALYNEKEIEEMAQIPFSPTFLKEHKDSHILIPFSRQNTDQMMRHFKYLLSFYARLDPPQEKDFIHAFTNNEWALLSKNATKLHSPIINPKEAQKELPLEECLPKACELFYAGLLHNVVRKAPLYTIENCISKMVICREETAQIATFGPQEIFLGESPGIACIDYLSKAPVPMLYPQIFLEKHQFQLWLTGIIHGYEPSPEN